MVKANYSVIIVNLVRKNIEYLLKDIDRYGGKENEISCRQGKKGSPSSLDTKGGKGSYLLALLLKKKYFNLHLSQI